MRDRCADLADNRAAVLYRTQNAYAERLTSQPGSSPHKKIPTGASVGTF